jgi:hypothetical protein
MIPHKYLAKALMLVLNTGKAHAFASHSCWLWKVCIAMTQGYSQSIGDFIEDFSLIAWFMLVRNQHGKSLWITAEFFFLIIQQASIMLKHD